MLASKPPTACRLGGFVVSEGAAMTRTIEATVAAINAEHQAMKAAESRQDADAWCGAAETRDSLLDDLCALYRQRQAAVSTGLAPVL